MIKFITNAGQAIGEAPGIIRVAQRKELADGAEPRLHSLVRDNGGGIAPEMLDRIFEPFFTTRRRARAQG